MLDPHSYNYRGVIYAPELSIMLPESSIMLLENIFSTGVTHDDRHLRPSYLQLSARVYSGLLY
jgi:hypothetical protein